MLRVIVEIVPGGREREKRVIGELEISNITELAEDSDYRVVARLEGKTQKPFVIKSHRRSLGWGPLVVRIIQELKFKERAK